MHGQYNQTSPSENKSSKNESEVEPIPIKITQGYSREPSGSQSLMGETPFGGAVSPGGARQRDDINHVSHRQTNLLPWNGGLYHPH